MFQIFAQLIELRSAPLPGTYMAIFRPLLAPLFWERPGNIPALTRLLQAYCGKAMPEIAQQGLLQVCLSQNLYVGVWFRTVTASCAYISFLLFPERWSHNVWCNILQGVLGIFQKLVASRVHDQDGFRILEALLDNLPLETLQPYMTEVGLPCALACNTQK